MAYDYMNLKRFEKSQVNGLTKHLAGLRFNTPDDPNKRTRLNDVIFQRADELGLEIDYNDMNASGEKLTFKTPRKITAEQTKFGKAWLREYFFKKNGEPRGGKRTKCIGDDILRVAKSVVRFEFIGVMGLFNSYGEMVQFVPIYRAYGRNGRYFDYAPIHWGEPLISQNSYETQGGAR